MRQRESRRLLGGVQAGKPGRGSENKAPFMAAVELEDDFPLHARFDPIDDDTGETFAAWARSALHPSAHLVTENRRLRQLQRGRCRGGRAWCDHRR